MKPDNPTALQVRRAKRKLKARKQVSQNENAWYAVAAGRISIKHDAREHGKRARRNEDRR